MCIRDSQKSIQRGDDVKQALREILIEKLNVGDTALEPVSYTHLAR